MVHTRQNVWEIDDWADPVLWYARGVKAMKQRPLDDPTSWRFYGAIHGIYPPLWRFYGYLTATDQAPANAAIRQFWTQCQHGSWYFLPWHRGYVLAFEAVVRAAVVGLGGPEQWALPYWNYFKPGQSALPRAFASPDWPDGQGDNPLFVEPRYGPDSGPDVFVPLNRVNLLALADTDYTGVSGGGSTGFGGIDTGFSHGGNIHGGVETQPHDWVHGLVGGRDPNGRTLEGFLLGGLMSDPDTAGLDPIFWLHHGNIDRLWESWVKDDDATHVNPTDPRWLGGPLTVGERGFAMPMPGGAVYEYTPDEVTDLAALDYEYDDLEPAGAVVAPAPMERMAALGFRPVEEGAVTVSERANDVELVGSNDERVPLRGAEVRSRVSLDRGMRQRVARTLSPASARPAEGDRDSVPDRVFLNLENVRGQSDASAFNVFVGVPDDGDVADYPDHLAGSIAPFGVRKATSDAGGNGGQGLTFVLEITAIVDRLHLEDSFDVDDLSVRLVPLRPFADAADMSIGRISIYRQGR